MSLSIISFESGSVCRPVYTNSSSLCYREISFSSSSRDRQEDDLIGKQDCLLHVKIMITRRQKSEKR